MADGIETDGDGKDEMADAKKRLEEDVQKAKDDDYDADMGHTKTAGDSGVKPVPAGYVPK